MDNSTALAVGLSEETDAMEEPEAESTALIGIYIDRDEHVDTLGVE